MIDQLRAMAKTVRMQGFGWSVQAHDLMEQAADRLASLEQQVTVVDDLPICGAECEAIADRLEAAEAKLASLEQAQQALRAQIQQVIETCYQGHTVRVGPMEGPMRDEPVILLSVLRPALSTILTSQETNDQGKSL